MAESSSGKRSGSPKSGRARTGWMSRVFRLILLTSGVLTIFLIIDYGISSSYVKGRWQFQANEIDETTVDLMMDKVAKNSGRPVPPDRSNDPRFKDLKSAMTKIGNRLVGAAASHVYLDVTAGGFRVDGASGALSAGSALARATGGNQSVSGCLSGSFVVVFPLVRATCGDGSGRTLWFWMKQWPSSQLALFPLPIGNREMRDKIQQMVMNGDRDPAQLKAANNLLTLRFKRL